MAMQTATAQAPSAQVVGNAFVEQYYHILHHSPELVFKFYQDSSILSRQEPDGIVTTVTTMEDINEKICSLDSTNYKAEIMTADAQDSFKDGVIVLVTGCLTGKDKLKRKFAQTFFLAPQDKGYFVLNDVFRYVEESESDSSAGAITVQDDSQVASVAQSPELPVLDHPNPGTSTFHAEEIPDTKGKAHEPMDGESKVGDGRETVVEAEPHSTENHVSVISELVDSSIQDDTSKKSYASIVSSQMKGEPIKMYVPTNTSRAAPLKTEKQLADTVPQEIAEPTPPASSVTTDESKDSQEEVEGYSIYIRNLPLHLTVSQLEMEFKKFGLIKQGGVQVRTNWQHGFCFGFVEFQDLSSMHSAIQASPITIGGRQAVVEMKRTTTRVGSGRGRFFSGRGGLRGESFRGRGNFYGGRGYLRNDVEGRNNFPAYGWVQGGRGGEGYHQVRGRGGRRGAYQNVISI